jgi:hypothetical protein
LARLPARAVIATSTAEADAAEQEVRNEGATANERGIPHGRVVIASGHGALTSSS